MWQLHRRVFQPIRQRQLHVHHTRTNTHFSVKRLQNVTSRPTILCNAVPTRYYEHLHFQQIQTRPFVTGIVGRITRFFRVIFGANETSPRGLQERQDSYWLLLALQCRDLRIARQNAIVNGTEWKIERREEVAAFLDEAADILDQKSAGIHDASLAKLRKEVQKRLEPQILDRLTVASSAEEQFGGNDEYEFDDRRVDEYKEILIQDYDSVCEKLMTLETTIDDNRTTSSRHSFYQLKKRGIERLLSYYNWWSESQNIKQHELTDDQEDEFGFCPSKSSSEVIPAMRYHHTKNLIRSYFARHNNMLQNQNFSITALRSTIPKAGRGVFIDGYAPAGTLLAFFPGKVWPKDFLMSASVQTQMHLSENDPRHQLSMRYDDMLIDSRRSPYTVYENLWALAHVVNHPPPPPPVSEHEHEPTDDSDVSIKQLKCGPNCVTVPINYTKNMLERLPDEDLKRFIPNEYEVEPKPWAKNAFDTEDIVMHGMGIVSLRDVHDEELFYDYRLSPDDSGKMYPEWYHVWNEDAAKNRWSSEER